MKLSARGDCFLLTDDDTGENVVVPAHEFRRAVNHQVGAKVERARVARRGKSTIDAHEATRGLAQVHDSFDIDATKVRVRW